MQDTKIYIEKLDGNQRQIEWAELNQLKKDILWLFDENGNELANSFVPEYSFTLLYWEYLTITGDKHFYEEQKQFYKEGALIAILCLIAEYVDIQGGSQHVFGENKIQDISTCVNRFEPINEKQNTLKNIVILGLSIASAITAPDILKNEDFEHPHLKEFYDKLPWVSKTFIQPYYHSKMN